MMLVISIVCRWRSPPALLIKNDKGKKNVIVDHHTTLIGFIENEKKTPVISSI